MLPSGQLGETIKGLLNINMEANHNGKRNKNRSPEKWPAQCHVKAEKEKNGATV